MMNEPMKEYLPYKILYQNGRGEVVEKRSRFLAEAAPAKTEEEALAFIEAIKRKHYDARHNCYAYAIGQNRETVRYSDDGEPGGCAGKPILEVLIGAELTDTVIAVTRYFGGTLLGTGGLVRAYTQAAREGLAASRIATMRYGVIMILDLNYTDVGKVQYLLAQKEIEIIKQEYSDLVNIRIRVPYELKESLEKALVEATSARAGMKEEARGYYREHKDT